MSASLSTKGIRVCHVSILHHRLDSRIMARQCLSLQKAGFVVNYVVADGEGDAIINKVNIYDIGLRGRFWRRLIIQHIIIATKAFKSRSKIIHLHDPELILLGLLFKIGRKKIIIDFHEDTPSQILDDTAKSMPIKLIIFYITKLSEYLLLPFYNYIITASDQITKRLKVFNKNCLDILNYPDTEEFEKVPAQDKIYDIIYSGSISERRGIYETFLAIENTNIKYAIMGDFQGRGFERKIKQMKAWKENTTFLGSTGDRHEIIKAMKQSKIGMCNLLITKNHSLSMPTKIFEYFAAGIPVIASNIPKWKEILALHSSGISIGPQNLEETRIAILTLLKDERLRESMAENGYKISQDRYSWASEEKKLTNIYESIINPK